MKTELPEKITTIEEAENLLSALWENGESFHPEDNAHDIIWGTIPKDEQPTAAECDKLNALMSQIYDLKDVPELFDPCGFILDFIDDEERRAKLARPTEY